MSDLISRREAIEAFEKFIHEIGIDDAPYNYGEIALCEANVPSADRVGKWMEQERGIHTTKYKCSECGRVVWDDTGYDVCTDYPYCNCGARMKGAEDESKD